MTVQSLSRSDLEQMLNLWRFTERRTRGEYFDLTAADVAVIKAIQTVGGKAVRHVTTLEATRVKVLRE